MKVIVQDSKTLRNIEPKQFASYLQTHGWYEDRPFLDNATIWLYKRDVNNEFEILLPLKASLGDYAARIAEALSTLEIVENRSKLEILNDLLTKADNIEIQGMVVDIKEADLTGTVTLMGIVVMRGIVVGKLQRIKVELKQGEYTLAIKAYNERLPVICTGDLVKEDSLFLLNNLRQFVLL